MTVKIKSDPDFTLALDSLSAYLVEFCGNLWREPLADHDRESAQHCSQFIALAASFGNIHEATGDICKMSLWLGHKLSKAICLVIDLFSISCCYVLYITISFT